MFEIDTRFLLSIFSLSSLWIKIDACNVSSLLLNPIDSWLNFLMAPIFLIFFILSQNSILFVFIIPASPYAPKFLPGYKLKVLMSDILSPPTLFLLVNLAPWAWAQSSTIKIFLEICFRSEAISTTEPYRWTGIITLVFFVIFFFYLINVY